MQSKVFYLRNITLFGPDLWVVGIKVLDFLTSKGLISTFQTN